MRIPYRPPFGAYLGGIETGECETRYPRDTKFGAYLGGIETGAAGHGGQTGLRGFGAYLGGIETDIGVKCLH